MCGYGDGEWTHGRSGLGGRGVLGRLLLGGLLLDGFVIGGTLLLDVRLAVDLLGHGNQHEGCVLIEALTASWTAEVEAEEAEAEAAMGIQFSVRQTAKKAVPETRTRAIVQPLLAIAASQLGLGCDRGEDIVVIGHGTS